MSVTIEIASTADDELVSAFAHLIPQLSRSSAPPTQAEKAAKTERVMAAGMALAHGEAWMKPLCPAWDLRWMRAMAEGDLAGLCRDSEASIDARAGRSAHESKTWLVARAALPQCPGLPCPVNAYRAVPSLIAGYGVMFMHTAD